MQVLTITALLRAQATTFGQSPTEYFSFMAQTAAQKPVQVMITENVLVNAGYSRTALHQVLGAQLLLNNSVNSTTGEVTTAEERVSKVLNGEIYPPTGKPLTFVIANAVDSSLTITDEAIEHRNTVDTKVQVELALEKERNRLKEQAARTRQRALARQQAQLGITSQPPVTTPEPTAEEVAPEVAPVAAEDSPF